MNDPQPRPRLWEIDTLRGVAVVAMAFFHFMWDLWFMGLTSQDIPGPGWQTFARLIGGTFTFLLGVALVLSRESALRRGVSPYATTLKRGLVVLGCGMLITIGTYFFVPDEYVRFGILHHAGVAMLLGMLFVPLPAALTAALGALIVVAGFSIGGLRVDHPWFTIVGVPQAGVGMVDYYPLAPWFGVALLGIAAGHVLYRGGARQFGLPDLSARPGVPALRWLGRNSLPFYMLHQPVLLAILMGGHALGAW